MPIGDIEKMVAVGLIWGATNAFMRKGAVIWDQKSLESSQSLQSASSNLHQRILFTLKSYLNLFLTWQYSVPLILNLSASASFFAILGHTSISLAVPVTNATTFAATAVMGILLGEKTRLGYALFGTFLIVLGVWLCVM
ncbi:uncharacterized protein LOC130814866 [Amaranthus tricolor]|uniref:uncharacterized protein LOC130814866 n=1 Tax=Amaranthus tricolor TaxID=29722 RepID=UPI0025875BBB|nr:uncharacterized protein LOC130814866 [Amaranthus tricolor]